eukprot:sb/3478433/
MLNIRLKTLSLSMAKIKQNYSKMVQLTKIFKQPIRTRYLGHVTSYQPIRDQYFLIRSVPVRVDRIRIGQVCCRSNKIIHTLQVTHSNRPKQVNNQSELVI